MKRLKTNVFTSSTPCFSPFKERSMKLKGNSYRLREGKAFLPGSIRDAVPALVIKIKHSLQFHLKSMFVKCCISFCSFFKLLSLNG
ncbi:unnamed protein product [Trifolium pratense]|uniref:Uncharacterized protein n=1 Tax=Trifolium pratense TaxID=57577 RepID=A0ACB0M4U6_TRIPR|nr:unnamed protein product [Trifolium pratense]